MSNAHIFIGRDGHAVRRADEAVFQLRVRKTGFLSWRWELWEVAITWYKATHYMKAHAALRPTVLYSYGRTPTRWQAVHQATLFAIRHIPTNHSIV